MKLVEEEWLTAPEVAALLRVDKMSIYRLRDQGHLLGVRVGRSVRISKSSVEEYLRETVVPR